MSKALLFKSRKSFWILPATVLLVVGLMVVAGPTAQIRTDCGDVRYRLLGITIGKDEMPEPQRSSLLSIGGTEPQDSPIWITVPFRGHTSASEIMLVQDWYKDATNWERVDRGVFKLLVQDISKHLIIHGKESARVQIAPNFPAPFEMVWNLGEGKPNPNCIMSLEDYCRSHNYVPSWDKQTRPTGKKQQVEGINPSSEQPETGRTLDRP